MCIFCKTNYSFKVQYSFAFLQVIKVKVFQRTNKNGEEEKKSKVSGNENVII